MPRLRPPSAKLHEVAVQLRAAGAEPARWGLSAATQAQLERARTLLRAHPLRALASVALVAALVEVEFAVGILAGLCATALLTTTSGQTTRQRFVSRGRSAFALARIAVRQRAKRSSPDARVEVAAAPAL